MAQAFVLVGALPRPRALAELESTEAIRALGVIGHPDDLGSLIKLLDGTSHRVVFDALWALHEYRDYRAVPHAVRLASSRQMTIARNPAYSSPAGRRSRETSTERNVRSSICCSSARRVSAPDRGRRAIAVLEEAPQSEPDEEQDGKTQADALTVMNSPG